LFPTLKLGKHGQASTGTPSVHPQNLPGGIKRKRASLGVTYRAHTHTHTGVHEVRRDLKKGDELDRYRWFRLQSDEMLLI
jgi:hypothetical protein